MIFKIKIYGTDNFVLFGSKDQSAAVPVMYKSFIIYIQRFVHSSMVHAKSETCCQGAFFPQ